MSSSKPAVTDKFINAQGNLVERGSAEDLRSLDSRTFDRVSIVLAEEMVDGVVMPAVRAYDSGRYAEAVHLFNNAVSQYPELAVEVGYHIEICQRVLQADLSDYDHEYLVRLRDWNSASLAARAVGGLVGALREPPLQVQCKYCGHFIRVGLVVHHAPEHLDVSDPRSCQWCDRSFPLPDFVWDGLDGQAFLYYRHIVQEFAFYKEFEKGFRVNPHVAWVGGMWVKRPADKSPLLPEEVDEESESFRWGYELGLEWAESLGASDLTRMADDLDRTELSDLGSVLPDEVAEQRFWRLASLKGYDPYDEALFEALEFDRGLVQAVWTASLEAECDENPSDLEDLR